MTLVLDLGEYKDETNSTCPQGAQSLARESVSPLVMTFHLSDSSSEMPVIIHQVISHLH